MSEVGAGLIVFFSVLLATHAIDRAEMPLQLMPASRFIVAALAPVAGAFVAWLVLFGAGHGYSVSQFEAVIAGTWLVLALGAWMRERVTSNLTARVVVIGGREFAADFAAELTESGVTSYEVVGWVGSTGPAEYRRLRWLGPLHQVRDAVIGERIDLLVLAPSAGDPAGSRIEDVFGLVADECLDLPVRLIAANQLYEELFGHVPVGTIDAAWYRYIMHPRYRAACAALEADLRPVAVRADRPPLRPADADRGDRDQARATAGPILYRQQRLGEFGRPFSILKLRTMQVDAERDGPQWAEAGDPR